MDIRFVELHVKPRIPEKISRLMTLSYNLWSTWDTDAGSLFRRIDPVLYRKCDHNPVKLLHVVSRNRLEELAEDNGFMFEIDKVWNKFEEYLRFSPSGNSPFNGNKIAYFSMEYGLHESLPVYSGGLGVLAGDYLKSASDQGVPLIAFGLLYKYGYFSQHIAHDGLQHENYHLIEWFTKPVRLLLDESGEVVINKVRIRKQDVYFRTWWIEVGRIKLYLLDADLPQNPQEYREITDILYDARKDRRLMQEILLAYGSLKLMDSIHLSPTLYHLNEGHSALLVLERMRRLIRNDGMSQREAREVIYQSTVFTTHTPVIDGNEHYDRGMVLEYLQETLSEIGLSAEEFYAMGGYGNDITNFWLPAFALRHSRYANAVSRLHGEVSRHMWQAIYPSLYPAEIPITHVTNGVHIQSWVSEQIIDLFDRYIGPDYLHMAERKSVWNNVKDIPDSEIWEAHRQRKEQMVNFLRSREERMLGQRGITEGGARADMLDPRALTIGFARRFAPYKRADLILDDPDRLYRLLTDENRPVQFIFAGKAHPADDNGKNLIRRLITFAREHNVEDRFVFIEDYDMNISRHLVQGVDVWLNNPIRPLEASGTSGMKAGMNGVLNLSVLDGWWEEGFAPGNGWAVEARGDVRDEITRRRLEAAHIYDLIEFEIAPLYYKQDKNVPVEWVRRMKNAIHEIGMNFNTHRMLREYVELFYQHGIEACTALFANRNERIQESLVFEDRVNRHWDKVKVVRFACPDEVKDVLMTGDKLPIEAIIDFDGADVADYQVEAFYVFDDDNDGFSAIPLMPREKVEGNVWRFSGIIDLYGTGNQKLNVRIRPVVRYTMHTQCAKWWG
jgi:starch phosphorylase